MKKYTWALGLCLALTGCLSSGPEKPLEEMAQALDARDADAFLAQMDMKRFAKAEVEGMTQGNSALEAIDNVGKFLGLGGVGDFLGTVLNTQDAATKSFSRGVSTGELINQCTRSQKPNCPWVPESLRTATIKELSDVAAVAQITTPAGMTSWLALAKEGDVWKVVGQAVLEKEATQAAKGIVTQQNPSKSSATPPKQSSSDSSDPYAPAPPPPAAPSAPKESTEPKKEDPYAPAPPPPATRL